jgi:hypothetical protein
MQTATFFLFIDMPCKSIDNFRIFTRKMSSRLFYPKKPQIYKKSLSLRKNLKQIICNDKRRNYNEDK